MAPGLAISPCLRAAGRIRHVAILDAGGRASLVLATTATLGSLTLALALNTVALAALRALAAAANAASAALAAAPAASAAAAAAATATATPTPTAATRRVHRVVDPSADHL